MTTTISLYKDKVYVCKTSEFYCLVDCHPPHDGHYLVYGTIDGSDKHFYHIADWQTTQFIAYYFDTGEKMDITHWAFLPHAPDEILTVSPFSLCGEK